MMLSSKNVFQNKTHTQKRSHSNTMHTLHFEPTYQPSWHVVNIASKVALYTSYSSHLHFLQLFRRNCSQRWEHDSPHLVGSEHEGERGPVDLLPKRSHPVSYHEHRNCSSAHHLAQQYTVENLRCIGIKCAREITHCCMIYTCLLYTSDAADE